MKTQKLIPAVVLTLLALPVFAQSTTTELQRDVRQQQRIENGLKSGQLTTREASKLERQESHVSKVEAKAMKDGTVTPAEQNRIQTMQNKVGRNINAQKHDAQVGNPASASSQRMRADVQRNVNQEKRIQNGVESGALDPHEAARMQRTQSRLQRKQARVGRDGHVSAAEQHRVRRAEHRDSRRLFRQKHDAQHGA